MNIVDVQGLRIQGLSVRTCNADEAQPDCARIGALWADFTKQTTPHIAQAALIYGVYHHYDSDANGAYDFLVGHDAGQFKATANDPSCTTVDLQAGAYAVFEARGDRPQSVINAWKRVWAYFAEPNCPHKRVYTTDFERYGLDGTVDIYIALAPA